MQKTITKENLNDLPLRQFGGEIFVVEDECQVASVVEELSNQEVLGFDTETRPSFKKGRVNQVGLLQLSTYEKAYLFRLNKMGFHDGLVDLLADPKILKVGVGIRDDIRGLKKLQAFDDAGFVELQDVAKKCGIEDFSLKKLAGILLDFRISKRQRLSNWEAEILTPAQLVYAATDAWVAKLIFDELPNSSDFADMS